MRRHAKRLQVKAYANDVIGHDGSKWEVKSATSDEQYTIFQTGRNELRCTCDWAKYNPTEPCTHTAAVTIEVARRKGYRVYLWASEEDARRQRNRTAKIGSGLWMTLKKIAKVN